MSVNKVILVGNAGTDPETRFMQNGESVANVSLATSESWKDKATGERKESTEWHRLVFFGKVTSIVADYVRKGSLIYIEGKIKTRKWTDKQTGQDRYTTEIHCDTLKLLGRRESALEPQPARPKSSPAPTDDLSDDIPF